MKKEREGLSAWQLTMLALGTVIGGSFFLGSAVAIHAAGPEPQSSQQCYLELGMRAMDMQFECGRANF